ncbi:NAD(P)-binding domain-containing protein [Chryseobacterium sp. MDT2-18]|uniref:NAD(P)-binding domain-containing protein n=1 Tax=Chryseobacterium sp. MDT2-18 TaxID=1259136 RepID=UPI00278B9842|nr:NAD(P)-binding domain-containing protein [Chryseobacterium sp. MDT2-18]MDQ0478098.1 nucleoside-diphosphate-sugar epimerase [Chryseobacterium sp. MDT2-18]
MRIAIIGCGWVGEKLARYWTDQKHHVIATTTTPGKIIPLKKAAAEVHLLDFQSTVDFDFLNDIHIAVFSMPVSRNDWHRGFEKLDEQFSKTIFFSSTGIYPQEDKVFTESDTENLRTDILTSENIVRKKYPQTTILRFGGLMGNERSLQNFFKNRLPENPDKPTNYIHYEDIVAIAEQLIHSEIKAETYNVVAPEHPSIGEVLNLENKSNSDKTGMLPQRIISSQHLIQDFNYTFIHPNPKCF